MQKGSKERKKRKPQTQASQPGIEEVMEPKPKFEGKDYFNKKKLLDKVAVITGGDSGIGRAVAVAFAKEGCNIAIIYLNEHKDAKKTKQAVEEQMQECMIIAGDVGDDKFCKASLEKVFKNYGRIDILVNNAAVQFPQKSIMDITKKQLLNTFGTNILSQFYMTGAALKYLKKGSVIINTTSVTAYRGSPHLIDYASTKGAIVGFTRSLAGSLVREGIRVNAVAPGPIWTPLIPSSFDRKKVQKFGSDVPMGRAGEPEEVAPCYVFLASEDSSYMTGQVLHPNGGEIVNG